jgi:putative oxidoreductase
MANGILSSTSRYTDHAIGATRIIIGFLMVYHGWEVFDAEKMKGYSDWLTKDKFPGGTASAWIGKGLELVAGIFLMIGFLTRPAALLLALTMLGIAFGLGGGKVWMEDQHPFLFVLFCVLFMITGAGKWSVEREMERGKAGK